MRNPLKRIAAALILVAGAAAAPAAAQESWPSRPVRVIVPYAAGGSTDGTARLYADMLSKALGQQFVIENKGGASGTIGTETVA